MGNVIDLHERSPYKDHREPALILRLSLFRYHDLSRDAHRIMVELYYRAVMAELEEESEES